MEQQMKEPIELLVELYNTSEEVRTEILGIVKAMLEADIVAKEHGIALDALLIASLDTYFGMLADDLQSEALGDPQNHSIH